MAHQRHGALVCCAERTRVHQSHIFEFVCDASVFVWLSLCLLGHSQRIQIYVIVVSTFDADLNRNCVFSVRACDGYRYMCVFVCLCVR